MRVLAGAVGRSVKDLSRKEPFYCGGHGLPGICHWRPGCWLSGFEAAGAGRSPSCPLSVLLKEHGSLWWATAAHNGPSLRIYVIIMYTLKYYSTDYVNISTKIVLKYIFYCKAPLFTPDLLASTYTCTSFHWLDPSNRHVVILVCTHSHMQVSEQVPWHSSLAPCRRPTL